MSVELPISGDSTGFQPHDPVKAGSGQRTDPKAIQPLSQVGDYLILEKLSRGGMGVVYKAEHRVMHRVVALKTVLNGSLAGDEELKRFRTEAEAIAMLDHPNIVRIFDAGEHEGQPFFTMQLIEGGNLARWAVEHSPLVSQSSQALRAEAWIRRAVELIATVADAVDHAHKRGILHRDLKPSNILIDGEGNPYVTDFGLARLFRKDSDLTLTGAAVGTPNYMAPEQAQGRHKQLTTAADVFSLGAILYELLTGTAPFNGETPLETVRQVVEAEPPRPSLLNRNVDRDLETICLKCLEKDPLRRYQAAKDLSEDLERWANHETITARPATASERAHKWLRRHPVRAAVIGFILMSVVGFGITMVYNQARVRRERDQTEAQLAKALLREGEAYAANKRLAEAKQKVLESRALSESKGLNTLAADLALMDIHRFSPPPLLTLRGHTGQVSCVAVSLDERSVFSGGEDGTIRRWSFPMGREELAWTAHPGGVAVMARSPDGHVLVSAGKDGSVKAWDAQTLKLLTAFAGHSNQVTALVFSTNGTTFASASRDGTICISDTGDATPRMLKTDQSEITGITFTPTEQQIIVVSSDGSGLGVWNLEGPLKRAGVLSANRCTSLATSAQRKQLFIANSDRLVTLRGWDGVQLPKPSILLRSPASALAVSSERGRVFAGSEDGSISAWDITQDPPALDVVMSDHLGAIRGIAPFRGDRFAVSAGDDGTIRVWNTLPQQGVALLWNSGYSVRGVAFSPDGLSVLCWDVGGYVTLSDPVTGMELLSCIGHEGVVFDAKYAPDGRHAASAGQDATVRIWDLSSGRELHRFPARSTTPRPEAPPFKCLAYMPDGRLILAGEGPVAGQGAAQSSGTAPRESRVHVLQTLGGDELTNFVAHRGGVLSIATSQDGRAVVTGGADGEVKLWDPATWREFKSLHADPNGVRAVTFRRNSAQCVFTGAARGAAVWDLANGGGVRVMPGSRGEAMSVAVSAGDALLLGGMRAGNLELWDLESGEELHNFSGFDSFDVLGVSFAPDRIRAITTAGRMSLWDFGGMAESRNREQAAITALRTLQRDPGSEWGLKTLGEWYEFRGAFDWALELFRRAQERWGEAPHLNMARCLWRVGDLKAARAELDRASAGQESPNYYLDLCRASITRAIEEAPTVDTALIPPAGALKVPAISGRGKDIWTTSHLAYAEKGSETPGGGKADEFLKVGGWGDEYIALLQFDSTGLPTNVSSAMLCLYCSERTGVSNAMYLERITADWDWRNRGTGWDRERLWWADRPPAVAWGSEPLPPPAKGRWYKFDITGLYTAWQRGSSTNHGLQLRPVPTRNERFNIFCSSRHSDPALRPQLIVVPAKDGL